MADQPATRKRKKSLGEILRSDVSLRTVKDILTYEIPLPYSRKTVGKLRDVLSGGGASDKELQSLISQLAEEGRRVLEILLDKGVITANDVERVEEESGRTGLSLPQTLVNLNIVSPDQIAGLAQEIQRDLEARAGGETLEDLLSKAGLVKPKSLQAAKELARKERMSLEAALLASEAVSLDKLRVLLKKHFGIDVVDLGKTNLDRAVVNLIPDSMMKDGRLIAFRRKGKDLHLAMANPRDETTLDRIRMLTGLKPVPFLAAPQAIAAALAKYLVEVVDRQVTPVSRVGKEELEALVESDSTVRMVSNIIEGAVHARATDIHVESQESGLRVRYRIDGMLYDIMRIPGDLAAATISRMKVLGNMDITERRRPQDGHISVTVDRDRINLRVSTLPTQFGEKVVLRVLDYATVVRGLSQLGMTDQELERFKGLIARPHGMVLVTGPMGSGKTTTLYAALEEVNSPNRNIVTIEDPIEYQLPGVNQVQVDGKVNLSFATGLRAILRQDANVLMVGEIRDQETALVAGRAASTGHLILSTLHTNSAVGAITTLRNLGLPSYVIANTLICVVAQRLLRVVCPECAEKRRISKSEAVLLGLGEGSRRTVLRAVGCEKCYHTGYAGRTGVYEILENTTKIAALIADEKGESDILKAAASQHHNTLIEAAARKVLDRTTTPEEVFRTIAV